MPKLPSEIRAEIEKAQDYIVTQNRTHQDAVNAGNRHDHGMTTMNDIDRGSSNSNPGK